MPFKDIEKRKSYSRAYNKEWYVRNKEQHVRNKAERIVANRVWWTEYRKTLACARCGENHLATLDFHHNDPSQKEHNVGYMIQWAFSRERILEEVAKCTVLCSNCHRKLHWTEK